MVIRGEHRDYLTLIFCSVDVRYTPDAFINSTIEHMKMVLETLRNHSDDTRDEASAAYCRAAAEAYLRVAGKA